MNKERLTISELGELQTCANCGKNTYVPANVEVGRLLPEGFTVGNARMKVRVRGALLTVCANCRYGEYGRY